MVPTPGPLPVLFSSALNLSVADLVIFFHPSLGYCCPRSQRLKQAPSVALPASLSSRPSSWSAVLFFPFTCLGSSCLTRTCAFAPARPHPWLARSRCSETSAERVNAFVITGAFRSCDILWVWVRLSQAASFTREGAEGSEGLIITGGFSRSY